MKEVSKLMKVFSATQAQLEVGKKDPEFVAFLAQETQLDQVTVQEYIELMHDYLVVKSQKIWSECTWTEEERNLFKKFYQHLRSFTNKKGEVFTQFAAFNGRTPYANERQFYKLRSFYESVETKLNENKKKSLAPVVELRTNTAEQNTVLSQVVGLSDTQSIGFIALMPGVDEQTTKLATSNETAPDTLLPDLQRFLQNASQLQGFDLSGLVNGLATLSELALAQQQQKETVEQLNAELLQATTNKTEQTEQLNALEEKMQQIHTHVTDFQAASSVEKITTLTDFVENLTIASQVIK